MSAHVTPKSFFGCLDSTVTIHGDIIVPIGEQWEADLIHKACPSEQTSLWYLLENRSWKGKRSKKDINQQVKKERASWKK